MTVKELIDCLQTCPEDYYVLMDFRWKEWDNIKQESVNKCKSVYLDLIKQDDHFNEIRLTN